MDDEQSAPVVENDAPATDDILSALSDTEDVEAPVVDTVDETLEAEDESDAETEPEVEQPEEDSEDLQPELDPKEEARRRYEERQQARAEALARTEQQTEEYINSTDDELEQRMRTIEAREYTRTIDNNLNTLVSEFNRVKANPDLQIFNPDDKETFNEKAYTKALKDFNAGYLEYDGNDNVVGIKGSLYEHLTETAELLNGAVKSGAVQQVRATRRMRSTADTKPAAPPKEAPKKDPVLDILSSD